jgi:hypothetical protein
MKAVFLVLGLICSMLVISGCNLNQEPIVIPGNQLSDLNVSNENVSNEIVLNESVNITNLIDLNLSNISELNISNITP